MRSRASSHQHLLSIRKIALPMLVLVVVVLGSLAGCRPSPNTPPQPVKSSENPFDRLRSHSGGYIRPPGKQRVIVFVNGIFGDAVSTWTNAQTGEYWPESLSKDADFDDVDVYVHSFDSPKIATAQTINELASRLKDFLEVDKVVNHKQIIFICHSMGGLVVRAYLLKVMAAPEKFPMIFFYATPTNGANVAAIATHVSRNPQLKDMLPLKEEGYVGDLEEQWIETYRDPKLNYPAKIASFCAYEKLDTDEVRIVEKQSAIALCNRETRGIVTDHIGIVKPADDRADAYVAFKAAYDRTFGPEADAIAVALYKSAYGTAAGPASQTSSIEPAYFDVSVQRVRVTKRSYFEVGCGSTKEGVLPVNLDLKKGDEIIQVVPSLENQVNLSNAAVAVVSHENNTAFIRYSLRGLNWNLLGCPGGGHADVVVSFVVKPAQF
jgi:hypothetical protein